MLRKIEKILKVLLFVFIGVCFVLLVWVKIDRSAAEKRGVFDQQPIQYPIRQSNITMYTDGKQLNNQLFLDIKKAKYYVHINFFSIADDKVSHQFLDLLRQKSQESVEVYYAVDRLGGILLKKRERELLVKEGVHFTYYNKPAFPYLFSSLERRNHRRISVIDGRIGYIGGFNIGRKYLGEKVKLGHWRDYHLRIQGEGVQDLNHQFVLDWKKNTEQPIPIHSATKEKGATSHRPQERAEKLIELILSYGSTYVRSHCNIDPVVGLKNLENLKKALINYSDKISHEIVAFPQHGLLRSNVEGLMREAMKLGVTHVGGLDPTLVDGNMEKSLNTMVQIAADYNAGIDIHLHEGGETGIKAIRLLADLTEQAGLQGKVTISHAFSLASLSSGEDVEMADRLASLGISIASSVPIGKSVMPIPLLLERKVNVMLGNDSITDHWDPFGIGDTLQKAHLAAQLYGWKNEYNLSRAISLATGGITPLNESGKQIWPKAGDEATAVLVPASCSAEAVARLPKRTAVLHKGALASGVLETI